MNKTEKTAVSIIDALPEDLKCSPRFSPKSILIDFENKMVFMDGIERGEILDITAVENPDGVENVLKILMVSDNKYLNGKTNFISFFEPR